MNFKKIITGVLAGAMAVSAMAVSSFADDAKTDLKLKMVVMVDGLTINEYPMSQEVSVTGDGTYNFKVEGIDVSLDKLCTLYIKDNYAIEKEKNGEKPEEGYKSPVAGDFSVTGFTLKINGKDVAIDDSFLGDMKKEFDKKGLFDYCLYNIWTTNYIEIADGTTINSVEITMTVGKGGEPAAPSTEATDPAGTTPAGTSPVGDPGATTPDKNQPNTGVEGVAVVAALAVVATGAVVIAKKRK